MPRIRTYPYLTLLPRLVDVCGGVELRECWLTRHRIIFEGKWNGYLPLRCKRNEARFGDPRTNTEIGCELKEPGMVIRPVVTWYTSNKTVTELGWREL